MSAQKIGMLLGSAEFKPLVQKARRLTELHNAYLGVAPPQLARSSRVAGYRSGTLVLAADNAAVAAKLRQLTPRLLKHLNELEPQVTAIRIRVQPANPAVPAESATHAGLSANAVAHFQELARNVGNARLKSALDNLVSHHRRRRRSGS